jgi:hypothetical protein
MEAWLHVRRYAGNPTPGPAAVIGLGLRDQEGGAR